MIKQKHWRNNPQCQLPFGNRYQPTLMPTHANANPCVGVSRLWSAFVFQRMCRWGTKYLKPIPNDIVFSSKRFDFGPILAGYLNSAGGLYVTAGFSPIAIIFMLISLVAAFALLLGMGCLRDCRWVGSKRWCQCFCWFWMDWALSRYHCLWSLKNKACSMMTETRIGCCSFLVRYVFYIPYGNLIDLNGYHECWKPF